MTNERRIQAAQWVLKRIVGSIVTADMKVRLISAFVMAMFAGLAAAFGASDPGARTTWCLLWASAACAGMALAVLFGWLAAVPRVHGPPQSIIFFGRIAAKTEDDYLREVTTMDEAAYLGDLAAQIHVNATIADKKHRWIKVSMLMLSVSSVPWVIAIGMLVRL